LGLVGVAWPGREKSLLGLILDRVYIALGHATGILAAGLVVGAVIPLAAASIAAFALGRGSADGPPPRLRTFAWITGGATLVLLVVSARLFFHLEPAQPGMRALFGYTLAAKKEYIPLLCGTWRVG